MKKQLSYPQPIDVYDPYPKNIENKVPESVFTWTWCN